MSFTIEERQAAIKESVDENISCSNCANTSDDGYKFSCHEWCCDVEDNEVCYKFEDKNKLNR